MSEQRTPSVPQDTHNRYAQNGAQTSGPSMQSTALPSLSSGSPALFSSNGPSNVISEYSATTAEILNRIREKNSGALIGSPASFEAKRAEVMQNYMTSDNLPTPPPIANAGKRGKNRSRVGTPSQLNTDANTSAASPATGTSSAPARGSGRGRPRGRGRGGGRGAKRRKVDTDVSDTDSDISSSYTPLPTRTKSGRNVNKPVSFVPTLPEPTRQYKRQRSAKAILAEKCSVCHRSAETNGNRIVFCDICTTAYHQYCHDPPIDNEVVDVLEKEWLCGPCQRSRKTVMQGTEGLVAAANLSIDEKRAYFSTLPNDRLVTLLLHATIRHPQLPIFPENVEELIPKRIPNNMPQPPATAKPPIASRSHAVSMAASPANGLHSSGHTPRSQHNATDPSEVDPAEAQLLGEFSHSHLHRTTSHTMNNAQMGDEYDEEDDDPPALYPKPGRGVARTLPPESEDLQWLVDDNTEVFSHTWKGDGTGVAANSNGFVNGHM